MTSLLQSRKGVPIRVGLFPCLSSSKVKSSKLYIQNLAFRDISAKFSRVFTSLIYQESKWYKRTWQGAYGKIPPCAIWMKIGIPIDLCMLNKSLHGPKLS